jgi:AraC-like DNA-binding protein
VSGREGVADSRVEQVQAAASRVFAPMRITPTGPGPFQRTFKCASAGGIVITRITLGPCTVSRPQRLITSTDRELVKIGLHSTGRGVLEQDGRQCELMPGNLVNYVTERPYELTFREPFETIVIGVPKGLLSVRSDLLRRCTALSVPTDSGAPHAVAGFMLSVAQELGASDEFTGNGWPYLADAMVSMVLSELSEVPTDRDDDLADKILAYCLMRLPDPDLSVASVARAHHMSVRQVHKLFECRDITLSAWIRRKRLGRIKRDLADPALSHRTVAAIAMKWGWFSAPHLSRALKAEFGCTAAEIRRTASTFGVASSR